MQEEDQCPGSGHHEVKRRAYFMTKAPVRSNGEEQRIELHNEGNQFGVAKISKEARNFKRIDVFS